MAIEYIGNAQGTPAANPTGGNFTVHANTQAGDLVIAQFYSRAATKRTVATWVPPADVNILIDQNTANGGFLWVGWWVAAGNSDSKAWSAGGVTNGSTGWGTATFRGVDTTSPFSYSNSGAAGAEATDSYVSSTDTAAGDALVIGSGGMQEMSSLGQPSAAFTTAGSWSTTLGTDASGEMSYDLDGGTGSQFANTRYTGMGSIAYSYGWAGSLKPASTGIKTSVNIGDAWKDATAVKINIGDSWKDVTHVSVNIGDSWKVVF